MANPRHRLGLEAETVVADQLARAGWQVLARRFRGAGGELDLVCLDPSLILVGIEVRARRDSRTGQAIETVDARKLARLRAGLVGYAMDERPGHRGVRIDLVTLDRVDGRWRMAHHAGIDAW